MVSGISASTSVPLNRILAAAMGSARPNDRSARTNATPAVEPANSSGAIGKQELSDEERAQIEELKRRDSEVRRHEQAHKSAAGAHAKGGPSFEFETGPDGKRYAVGGEVQIDLSPVRGDPQATIAKMQQVRSAALAPGQPSAQDRQVAAKAAALEREARQELADSPANTAAGSTGTADASFAASIKSYQNSATAIDVSPGQPRAGQFLDFIA